jgi:hypothetical protein
MPVGVFERGKTAGAGRILTSRPTLSHESQVHVNEEELACG